MSKLLLVAFAFSFSITSYATDWYTSSFTMNATYTDLVKLNRTEAFSLKGKAVISQDLYTGHLVVNGNAYPCRAVGAGDITGHSEIEFYCNLDIATFTNLLETEAIRKDSFVEAKDLFATYFGSHSSIEYVTIPVGFSQAGEERASTFNRDFLEPIARRSQVETSYSASGMTEF